MSRQEFIELWNKAFFPNDGQYNNANLDIEITLIFPGGTVQFEAKGIYLKTRINEIARLYANSLKEKAENFHLEQPVESATIIPEKEQLEATSIDNGTHHEREVIANEHIEYRGTPYLVQHYRIDGVDHYNLINEVSGASIGTSTVTGRTVLKKYREQRSSKSPLNLTK